MGESALEGLASAPERVNLGGTGSPMRWDGQRDLWDQLHERYWAGGYSQRESTFARDVTARLSANRRVLEIGCGAGVDAVFLAENGHSVTALDFSAFAIGANLRRHTNLDLDFMVHDITRGLPFPDNTFDVVFSRLSLHYFNAAITETIFQEIYRVLAPGGRLDFMCKSVDDPLYGKGDQLEPDVYVLDGHIRHFFSKAYARRLLTRSCYFLPERVWARYQGVYGEPSGVVLVTARKPDGHLQLRLF